MEHKSIDYKASLALVQELNSFVASEPQLRSFFLYKGYDLWQSYQAVLFSDAKVWSMDRRLSQEASSLSSKLKLFCVALALITISLASALYLFISKKTILVFTEDKTEGPHKNDFRLDALYDAMKLEKAGYMEVVHTIAGRETFKKFFVRGREIVYLESVEFAIAPVIYFKKRSLKKLISQLNLESFALPDREFVAFELLKLMSLKTISIARTSFFLWLLNLSDVKRLFSIDDTRHYNEFILAGRQKGIPTIAIQHGHFTKYQTGWLKMSALSGEAIRPRALLVWSKYWKDELLRLGTYFKPEEIVVGGRRHDNLDTTRAPSEKIAVLVPFEKDAPKHEVKKYIEKLLACKDIEVIFKLRIDQDKHKALIEYGILESAEKITVVRSIEDVMPRVSLCLGTYSTLLYDMVERLRTVAILETSLDYEQGMVDNGLADFIKKDDDLYARVKELSSMSEEMLTSRREKLSGGERRRLVSVLRDIIKEHVSN